jgi:hypothetical protein
MRRYPRRYKPLTQKRLKELLNYNPETGIFRWKESRGCKESGSLAGNKNSYGYIQIQIDRKLYNASRLAYLYIKGYLPEYEVDHEDRVRDNNKWENLRHASRLCNMRNKSIYRNNKSGVTGVYWSKSKAKYESQIRINGKAKYLGHYHSLIEAVKARWEAEVKYGFPNCNSTSSAYQFLQECK